MPIFLTGTEWDSPCESLDQINIKSKRTNDAGKSICPFTWISSVQLTRLMFYRSSSRLLSTEHRLLVPCYGSVTTAQNTGSFALSEINIAVWELCDKLNSKTFFNCELEAWTTGHWADPFRWIGSCISQIKLNWPDENHLPFSLVSLCSIIWLLQSLTSPVSVNHLDFSTLPPRSFKRERRKRYLASQHDCFADVT